MEWGIKKLVKEQTSALKETILVEGWDELTPPPSPYSYSQYRFDKG